MRTRAQSLSGPSGLACNAHCSRRPQMLTCGGHMWLPGTSVGACALHGAVLRQSASICLLKPGVLLHRQSQRRPHRLHPAPLPAAKVPVQQPPQRGGGRLLRRPGGLAADPGRRAALARCGGGQVAALGGGARRALPGPPLALPQGAGGRAHLLALLAMTATSARHRVTGSAALVYEKYEKSNPAALTGVMSSSL